MNPKAKNVAPDDLPPLDEVRRSRRIPWYRCPIDPAKLRELAQPSDSRGLFQATGHFAIWAATGTTAYHFFGARTDADPLAASIGGLAPRALA